MLNCNLKYLKTAITACLGTAFLSTLVYAAPVKENTFSLSVIPYYIKTNHKSVNNSDAETKGVYSYLGYGNHAVELEYDTFSNDSNVEEDHQIIKYSYYGISKWRFTLGYHNIDQKLQEGTMLIVGSGFTQYNKWGYKTWGLGMDIYQTSYDDAINFKTQQFSPQYTYNHVFNWLGGYSAFRLGVDYINFSSVLYQDDSFLSGYIKWEQHWKPFIVSLSTWGGESSYAVKNDGFLLFNSRDVQEEGYGISTTWKATKNIHLKAAYQNYDIISATDGSQSSFQRIGSYLTISF